MITTPTELNLALDATVTIGDEAIVGAQSRLRLVMVGGQSITAGTVERAERWLGATVLERYGMSEATYIAWNGANPADRRHGSCGRPLAAAIRILDEDGREVRPGRAGEIVILGPTLFPGYLDDPDANAAAFLPDGWFRTGDIGRVDGDGFLYLIGRVKSRSIAAGRRSPRRSRSRPGAPPGHRRSGGVRGARCTPGGRHRGGGGAAAGPDRQPARPAALDARPIEGVQDATPHLVCR